VNLPSHTTTLSCKDYFKTDACSFINLNVISNIAFGLLLPPPHKHAEKKIIAKRKKIKLSIKKVLTCCRGAFSLKKYA
jgi:hypothetical protein